MDVFISWSGERSRAAAEALRGWLPKIINAIKPWLSSADIDKGARWSTDVATRLEAAKAGIICLTPSNLHSDWILFEAGALSKTLQNTYVCPLLIGLEPSDVKPPLAQFQATKGQKEDILKLLKTLNGALAETALPEPHIEEAFEVWWPKLESQLRALPSEETKTKAHRPDRELLEELLGLVRSQNRTRESVLATTQDFGWPVSSRRGRHNIIKHEIRMALEEGGEKDCKLSSAQALVLTDDDIYNVLTPNGSSFRIRVPIAGRFEEAVSQARAQVETFLKRPRNSHGVQKPE
jgi:hypothetical protein